jgi:hypothetical protein
LAEHTGRVLNIGEVPEGRKRAKIKNGQMYIYICP